MLKKCVCFLIVVTMLISCFSMVASAVSIEEKLIEYYLTWFIDTSYDISRGEMSPDELIDWYTTSEGYLYLSNLISLGGAPGGNLFFNPGVTAAGYIQDANNHRYLTANVRRNLVNELYNTLNDYWSNDSAPLRDTSFANAGFSLGSQCLGLRGNFGNLGGSGPAAKYTNDPLVSVTTFCTSSRENGYAYLYNGSLYFPPVLYVPFDGAVCRYGESLRTGYYVIVDDYNGLHVNDVTGNSPFYFYYTDNIDTGGVDFFIGYSNSSFNGPCIYWYYDTDMTLYTHRYWNTNGNRFPGEFILEKFTKAVGYHISNSNDYPFIAPDTSIPYDDDDFVTVLVPIDEPAAPIYLSPITYNNYIDNGTYTYIDNDTVNNIVTDNDVTTVYNIYNNIIDTDSSVGGGYDDTNLLITLRSWFSEIVSKLNIIISILNQPMYDDFSDVYINVPLVGEVDELLNEFKTSVDTDTDPDPPTINISMYDTDTDIDFSWYSDVAPTIKPILRGFAYVSGVICCWLSLKSFFGIHRGDDG